MSQFRALQVILYQALAQPLGLLVRVQDPNRAQQRLYQAKYAANDVALADLLIKFAPPGLAPDDGEAYLVIYKKSALDPILAKGGPPPPQSPAQSRSDGLFDGLELADLLSPTDAAAVDAQQRTKSAKE